MWRVHHLRNIALKPYFVIFYYISLDTLVLWIIIDIVGLSYTILTKTSIYSKLNINS